ncbi:MAG: 30S ribosomal protein S12 methylthiotransferase RimO [Chlamydiales bacterium]|nr:30S ribosomal protein S12 methylthiotransferase RimO [Chlamydiales bacterium]
MSTGNKIQFISLGCARNLVDTEVMLGIVLKAGFEVIDQESEADFFVINTCGFLESARNEALSIIQHLFDTKKEDAKVIVAGCMVQKHKNILEENFPHIHAYLGSGDVENILQAILTDKTNFVSDAKSYLQQGDVPRVVSTSNRFAYLKIAEGCKKRCAFCIIPLIKGDLKSKSEEQILKEFHALINNGIHEVILIAQDLGDYGKDQKKRNGLAGLLRRLLDTKGDFWLRLLYLYPDEIDDEIISIIKSDKRICRYLDMPIQHINQEMLKAMHRKTSKAQIISIIERLRKEIPDIVIRTSIMVGFPGETEEQFRELVEFVKEYKLDNIGFFKYSQEKGSYSYNLENQVAEDVKESRLQEIVRVQQSVLDDINQKHIGKTYAVLVEGYHPDSDLLMKGRFYGQCPEIDGCVIINDGRKVKKFGQLYEVEITDSVGYDLIGKAVKSSSLKLETTSPFVII